MSATCPADVKSEENELPDGQATPRAASPSSLLEAVAELAAAIRAQNEVNQQLLMALVEQNAALIEALTQQDDEPALPKSDMAGHPIKVT